MPVAPRFIFVICQNGAEQAAKKELLSNHPELKFAFSRPGFLTFKIDPDAAWPNKFSLKSTLARTSGWSLGKVNGDEAQDMVRNVLANACFHIGSPSVAETGKSVPKNKIASKSTLTTSLNKSWQVILPDASQLGPLRHVHVWERDLRTPGHKGFEPGVTVLASEIGSLFESKLLESGLKLRVNQIARPDDWVFDLVLVEPNEWWFGVHCASTTAGRWPGGVPMIEPAEEPISRAYYKAAEALEWSGIQIQPGEWCAEIGSAPGGCCQLLLEKGAHVIGIDPAEMDESLLESDHFVHIRRRGNEVRKKDLAEVKWLFADLNLVPNYTLDTVSEIVSHERVQVKGLVLTMKLADWKLLDKLPELRARVAELGFQVVKTRQLAFNRQEFCLVAVRDKFLLRQQKQRPSKSKKSPSKKASKKSIEPMNEGQPQRETSESKPKPVKKKSAVRKNSKPMNRRLAGQVKPKPES